MAAPKVNEVQPKEGTKNSDPTYNVMQLVEAAVKRLDDLSAVRAKCTDEVITLNKEISNLHITYGEKLSIAESKRIDAIRAVDVNASAVDREKVSAQAVVLANQVATSAEALRALVATTAATAAAQFLQVTTQMMERISLLEKNQYSVGGQGVGKTTANKDMMDIIKLLVAVAAFVAGSKLF